MNGVDQRGERESRREAEPAYTMTRKHQAENLPNYYVIVVLGELSLYIRNAIEERILRCSDGLRVGVAVSVSGGLQGRKQSHGSP